MTTGTVRPESDLATQGTALPRAELQQPRALWPRIGAFHSGLVWMCRGTDLGQCWTGVAEARSEKTGSMCGFPAKEPPLAGGGDTFQLRSTAAAHARSF